MVKEIKFVLILLDPMWAIVTVVEEGTIALTQQLSHFNELGAVPPSVPVHNPFVSQRSHLENSQVRKYLRIRVELLCQLDAGFFNLLKIKF